MNFKTTYILFGILAGALGLLLLVQLFGKKPGEETEGNLVLPTLNEAGDKKVKTEDIARVEVEQFRPKSQKLVFERGDEGWRLREPRVRLQSNSVDELIREVMGVKHLDEEVDMTKDLHNYALDEPAVIVTLVQKDSDREWKLNIGKASIGGSSAVLYVNSSDRPQEALAVRRTGLAALFKDVKDDGTVEWKSLADFRARDLFTEGIINPADALNQVKVQQGTRGPVVLEKSSPGHWRYEKPPYGEADFDGDTSTTAPATDSKPPSGVKDLFTAMQAIRVESDEDFVEDGAKDLGKYGLQADGKDVLRIEIKGQISSFGGGEEKKRDVHDALLVGKKADDKGEKLYARLESENNVVRIGAKKVEAFTKLLHDPSLLRNRHLVEIDTAKTDAIDIQNAQGSFKLRRPDLYTWKLFDAAGKAHKADRNAAQDLLDRITGQPPSSPFGPQSASRDRVRLVKSFPDPKVSDAQLGLDKPVAVISLWEDGIKKEEEKKEDKDGEKKDDKKEGKSADAKKDDKKGSDKKDSDKKSGDRKDDKKNPDAEPKLKSDKPKVKLAFGKKEKEKDGTEIVYVRREIGSEVTRVAVPATVLDKVVQGKLAYFDKTVPSFESKDEIVRLLVLRDGMTYEVEKEKKDDKTSPWKFKQPKELAGRTAERTAVDRVLDDLRSLSPHQLIAEKASDSELARYGLNVPGLKAVVTVRKSEKETKDHVYLFGKETDDKADRYAKQGEHDLVFTVRKGLIDAIIQEPLEELTVFSFDVSKVKTVKLSGWQDVSGKPSMLDAERKGGSWAVKPADFKLDDGKLETFLAYLANLKAKRFVSHKGNPKPPDAKETKLDPKSGALDVTLTLEGEKEPLTLTIGALKMAEGHYAQSNKLPGDLFLLAEDQRIKDAKSKPDYFKKQ